MSIIERKILSFLRIVYKSISDEHNRYDGVSYDFEDASLRNQQASDLIKNRLNDDTPLMIGRFGATEIAYLTNSLIVQDWFFRKRDYYITNKINSFLWEQQIIHDMIYVSGFFPHSNENAKRYSDLLLEDIKYLDILGTWLYRERLLKKELSHTIKIQLPDIEPYFHENPWSEALEGKTVLVIHPFQESILAQYVSREKLFKDKRVLPKFNLKTIKAIQSAGNSKTIFKDWFESLDHMKSEMDKITFDIAIIGCGAYGFHLAAHAKRSGKKGIHLGGATQNLFGIIGKRWEAHEPTRKFMNQYWVRPLEIEKPAEIQLVENGCYW
ncbi:hypothetical protein [Emticicia sp.]|uniref:hypothetical protein n=1 Tax=Emticicia sp. TaxID=1930953 RepID=UPI003750945F